jgi:hypothetical protein
MPIPIDERLRLLHAHYTSQINAAVGAGRMDLVRDLANDCENEALALILTAEDGTSGQPNQRPVEILEFDGWPRWRGVHRPGTWRSWFRRPSSH